jgi:hypothetical protein
VGSAVTVVAPSSLASDPIKLVLPATVSWFSLKDIHNYERDALPGLKFILWRKPFQFCILTLFPPFKKKKPEFFSGSDSLRTPLIYKDYRDFMVHAYWQNPSQYLSYTACRRNLIGDACSILRVHQFLDQRGIINYQVKSATVPVAIPSIAAASRPPSQTVVQQMREQESSTHSLSGWSHDETLRLLGAVQQFGDDWLRVAGAVRSRTAHECVLHFVRLPQQ